MMPAVFSACPMVRRVRALAGRRAPVVTRQPTRPSVADAVQVLLDEAQYVDEYILFQLTPTERAAQIDARRRVKEHFARAAAYAQTAAGANGQACGDFRAAEAVRDFVDRLVRLAPPTTEARSDGTR